MLSVRTRSGICINILALASCLVVLTTIWHRLPRSQLFRTHLFVLLAPVVLASSTPLPPGAVQPLRVKSIGVMNLLLGHRLRSCTLLTPSIAINTRHLPHLLRLNQLMVSLASCFGACLQDSQHPLRPLSILEMQELPLSRIKPLLIAKFWPAWYFSGARSHGWLAFVSSVAVSPFIAIITLLEYKDFP